MINTNVDILLVDDDQEFVKVYGKILKLEFEDYNILALADSAEAIEVIKSNELLLVISDMVMPNFNGMEVLQKAKLQNVRTQVIILTGQGSIPDAVSVVNQGAYTYITKPTKIEEFLMTVRRALEFSLIHKEKYQTTPLIGKSRAIMEIRGRSTISAHADYPVLITGESGTGKEIIASLIHYQSKRKENPYIKVNCAALTETILESELFGHEKGSFTGALNTHKGKFELANKGTILLDEIGELSPKMQAKLLRVLQEKEFERVGGASTIKADFRLIASTNKNLQQEIKNGNFREDLYYRINVLPFHMPTLRERKEDIPLLANFFLNQIATEMNKLLGTLPIEVIELFMRYDWPGNIRELKNIVERMVVSVNGKIISVEDVPVEIRECSQEYSLYNTNLPLREAKANFEKQYIIKTLNQNRFNIAKSAEQLEIAKKNLYLKVKEYGIVKNQRM